MHFSSPNVRPLTMIKNMDTTENAKDSMYAIILHHHGNMKLLDLVSFGLVSFFKPFLSDSISSNTSSRSLKWENKFNFFLFYKNIYFYSSVLELDLIWFKTLSRICFRVTFLFDLRNSWTRRNAGGNMIMFDMMPIPIFIIKKNYLYLNNGLIFL